MKDLALLVPVYASFLVLSGCFGSQRFSLSSLANHVEIIAHRGASHLAPENTLASVELAWQLGADAVEVDVHLTADRRIVAIHDPSTGRTADRRLHVARTASGRLRHLDVGRHKNEQFAGEAIPFLEEVLATVPPGRQLFIEIKCGPEILPTLEPILTDSGKRSQVAMIGFELNTMAQAKEAMSDIPVHWLCDTILWAPYSGSLARKAKARGVDALNVQHMGITPGFIACVKQAGLKLYTWTVDNPADAIRLKVLGVDGITTNRPGWLRSRIMRPSMLVEGGDASQTEEAVPAS